MSLWDWSNRYNMAPPPVTTNRAALVQYWSDGNKAPSCRWAGFQCRGRFRESGCCCDTWIWHRTCHKPFRRVPGMADCHPSEVARKLAVTVDLAQKSPLSRRALIIQRLDLYGNSGGYGWTRTTDPSIMSAVL